MGVGADFCHVIITSPESSVLRAILSSSAAATKPVLIVDFSVTSKDGVPVLRHCPSRSYRLLAQSNISGDLLTSNVGLSTRSKKLTAR